MGALESASSQQRRRGSRCSARGSNRSRFAAAVRLLARATHGGPERATQLITSESFLAFQSPTHCPTDCHGATALGLDHAAAWVFS